LQNFIANCYVLLLEYKSSSEEECWAHNLLEEVFFASYFVESFECCLISALAIVAFAADFTDGSVKRLAVTVRRVLAFEVIMIVVVLAFSMRRLSLIGSAIDIEIVIVVLQFNNFVD